jgi:hypothetical protein
VWLLDVMRCLAGQMGLQRVDEVDKRWESIWKKRRMARRAWQDL